MRRKFSKVWKCGFCDMGAERHTEMLTAIKSYVITSTKEQAVKSYFQQNVGQRAQQTEGTSFLLGLEPSK